MPTADQMPADVRKILEEVHTQQAGINSNFDILQEVWKKHASEARRVVPGAHIEAEGEVLYLGQLSPGCRACKDGAWDCIFTTMHCNLDCAFCYSPHAIPRNYSGSGFGSTPDQIAQNHARTHITGISFSGGEPFLDAQRLFEWIDWFKSRYPDKYYWVYTNGLLAGEQNLRRLGDLGVDEIRFNLAATGYKHRQVMENLSMAARFVPNLTVEIPAIPAHASLLMSCLETWYELGVRFLNLHELMYEPGTNSAAMAGARQPIITPDGHRSAIDPASRSLTLAVMEKIQQEGLSLSVNDCSLQSKVRQLAGRRRSMAPVTKAFYEKMIPGELLESCCAFGDATQSYFFHPDRLDEMRERNPDFRFVRLGRTTPLSVHDKGKWVLFEDL